MFHTVKQFEIQTKLGISPIMYQESYYASGILFFMQTSSP